MLTPQELMDLPYAGIAESSLRAQKQWDETAALEEGKEYEFTVEVSGYYDPMTETQTYTVTASSVDDAYDLAENKCDFDHIDDCRVEKVREITE